MLVVVVLTNSCFQLTQIVCNETTLDFTCTMTSSFFLQGVYICTCTSHTLYSRNILSFNSAVALDLLMHDCVFVHTVVQGLTSFCTHAL